MAKEKYQKPKKSFIKKLFITLATITTTIVVAVAGVCTFAYFKYDVSTITLIKSIGKLDDFDSNSQSIPKGFSAEHLTTAKSKVDNPDFTDNYLFFTDDEIGAVINDELKTKNTTGYNIELLDLEFESSEVATVLTKLNFTIKLDAKTLKDTTLKGFPASIISSKLDDSLIITMSANIVAGTSGDTSYSVDYISLQINNLTKEETENLFRLINIFVKDFEISSFCEKFAKQFADLIIGNDTTSGVYTGLKDNGAKSYLFNKLGDQNCFSIFTFTLDEERNIQYTNTKDVTNPNLTVYTLKDGVITLQNLEKLGYIFDGWYNGQTKVETIETYKMHNYVLEAKWSLVNYTIEYNLKGGTVISPGNPTTYTIETDTFTIINPTKPDDTFIAWSGTGIDGETSTLTIQKGSTGNLSFVAHFEFDAVNVTFCVDGKTVYSYEFENDTTFTKQLADSTLAREDSGMVGYQVPVWYTDSGLTSEYVFGTKIKRDFTIYGKSEYFVSSPLNPTNMAKFNNALSTKSLTIENHDELVSWIFYVMFFGINENQKVTLTFNYIPKTQTAIYNEILLAKDDACDISNFQSGSTFSISYSDTYAIIYVSSNLMNSYATLSFNSTGYLYTQQGSSPNAGFADTRDENFNDFNISNVTNTMEVSNSEQLVFALEMGFNPVCKVGSSAELVYNKAKTVLRDICNNQMSNVDKAYAIYTWLIMNVQYDNCAYSLSTSGGLTAEQSRYYDSWFAEGVFNKGKAVCEGIAKAFLIMAKLENIPCIYVTGNNHAWNKVYVNGAWYGVDATHGNSLTASNTEILTYSEFLFTDSYKTQKGYSTTDHTSIKATTGFNFYDYFTIVYNGHTFDLVINSVTEFDFLLDYIIATTQTTGYTTYTIEFVIDGIGLSISSLRSRAGLKGLSTSTSYYTTTTTTGSTAYTMIINVA